MARQILKIQTCQFRDIFRSLKSLLINSKNRILFFQLSDERGDLVIHFNVDFPSKIPTQNLKQLHALLPGKSEAIVPDDATEHELELVTQEMLQNSEREEAAGRRVECASQ